MSYRLLLLCLPALAVAACSSEARQSALAEEETRAAVDSFYAGLSAKDMTQVPFDKNVYFTSPILYAPMRGDEPVKGALTMGAQMLEDLEVHRVIIDGETACAMIIYKFVNVKPTDITHCFVVQDGVIMEVRSAFDPRPFL